MNKTELIDLIRKNTNLSLRESKELTEVILNNFKNNLTSGKGIKFKGVFTLTPTLKSGRFYYIPPIKKSMYIAERYRYKVHVNKKVMTKLNTNPKFSFK